MSHQDRDPYVLLGINRNASASDISRAYRRAARATHPDSHPGDPQAGERFNAVTAAYETLRDPGRRASYDRAHPSTAHPSAARGGQRQVRLGTPWPADITVDLRFSVAPLGRQAPLRAGPVEVVPPAGQRPAGAHGMEDELTGLAAFLPRWFRAGW